MLLSHLKVEQPEGSPADQLPDVPTIGKHLFVMGRERFPELTWAHLVEIPTGEAEDTEGPAAHLADAQGRRCLAPG